MKELMTTVAFYAIVIVAATLLANTSAAQPVNTNAPPQNVDLKNAAIDPTPATSLMPGRTNKAPLEPRKLRPHREEQATNPAAPAAAAVHPSDPIKLQSAQGRPNPAAIQHPQTVGPQFEDGVRLGIIAKQRNIDVNDLNALTEFAKLYYVQERQAQAQQQAQQQRPTPAIKP